MCPNLTAAELRSLRCAESARTPSVQLPYANFESVVLRVSVTHAAPKQENASAREYSVADLAIIFLKRVTKQGGNTYVYSELVSFLITSEQYAGE